MHTFVFSDNSYFVLVFSITTNIYLKLLLELHALPASQNTELHALGVLVTRNIGCSLKDLWLRYERPVASSSAVDLCLDV